MVADWRTFGNEQEAFSALVSETESSLREALERRGRAHLILSGGRTPTRYLPELATALNDWHGVEVSLSDERWVDTSHPDSNEKMVRECFLVKAPGAHFYPLMGEGDDPRSDAEASSARYASLPWPADVTILGAAPDGHVASLFPGTDYAVDEGLVIATQDLTGRARLSLSPHTLVATRRILIAASGAGKLRALRRSAVAGSVMELPARLVMAQEKVPVSVIAYDDA